MLEQCFQKEIQTNFRDTISIVSNFCIWNLVLNVKQLQVAVQRNIYKYNVEVSKLKPILESIFQGEIIYHSNIHFYHIEHTDRQF